MHGVIFYIISLDAIFSLEEKDKDLNPISPSVFQKAAEGNIDS